MPKYGAAEYWADLSAEQRRQVRYELEAWEAEVARGVRGADEFPHDAQTFAWHLAGGQS
jgi:hypothetical protein